MTTHTVVVVGSINADLTATVARLPAPGETLLGQGGAMTAGGKGANQAVAAALQGAHVSMIGAVGSDVMATDALRNLRSCGVDLTAVATVDGPTGLAVITVSADGENTIVVIPGANSSVDAAYVKQWKDLIQDADIVLLQGEIPRSGFEQAVDLATGRVVVNLAPVVEVGHTQLLRADPLVVNEHEGELVLKLFGHHAATTEPREILTALSQLGFPSVVMTLGAAGALVAQGPEITDIPTPTITAVDTTGSGDAFCGALVAQLSQGALLSDAAAHAARVGAFAATKPGAQPSYPAASDELPTLDAH